MVVFFGDCFLIHRQTTQRLSMNTSDVEYNNKFYNLYSYLKKATAI